MATPTITSITPNHGPAGTQSVVVGTGLNQVTAWRVGGVNTPFVINSPTQLTFTLPSGITVGPEDVDFDYTDTVVDPGGFTDTATPKPFAGIYQFGSSIGDILPASVKGYSFIIPWSSVNPSNGVYDWSLIENSLAYAASKSKQSLIRVQFGRATPNWVRNLVPQVTISWDPGGPLGPQTTTLPIPWDATYLAKVTTFIAAYGAHYDGDSRLSVLAAAGAGWQGEMALPHPWAGWTSTAPAPNGCGSEPYTDARLIGAWETIIDAWSAAFTTTQLTLALDGSSGIPPITMTVPQLLNAIATHAIGTGTKYCFQQNGLRASSTVGSFSKQAGWGGPTGSGGSGGGIACQQYEGNNTVSDDNTMFSVAINAMMHFVEVYKSDVQNPALASALTTLAAGLH